MLNDFTDLLFDAVSIARGAGEILRRHFRSGNLHTRAKLNDADVVTIADAESEAYILGRIRELHPGHSILSEESGAEILEGAEYRWVIDPLDGTTNYSSGLPIFSISIAVKRGDETVVGVVYAPVLDELFTAVKGEGAFLNGNPIHVSENDAMSRAVISTGFPVDKASNPVNNVDNFVRVLPLTRGMRRLGSAAVDISYVAAGFLDAFWELNLHEWDVAAGLLILHEAGGVSKHFRTDRNFSIIASSKALFPHIEPLIK